MKRAVELSILISFLLGLALAAPDLASAGDTAGEAAAPKEVPAAYRSARATMRTFLEATVSAAQGQDASMDAAVMALDLSDLPTVSRVEKGREIAIWLKEVLDRVRFVKYEEIPDDAQGPPWVFYRHPDDLGSIVISRGADGWWRFSKSTVGTIDDLYRALEASERVEGVSESPRNLSPSMWLRGKLPTSLKKVGFLFEHWQWLGLLLIALLGVLIDRLFRKVVGVAFHRLLKERRVLLDREQITHGLRPFGLVGMGLFWRFGLGWLGLAPKYHGILEVAANLVAAVGGVWGAYRIVDLLSIIAERRASDTESKLDDLLIPLLRKSAKVLITGFGFIFIADVVDVSVTSLLAGLGLAGMALALAAQDMVKNLFGSITVLLDRPFVVGDWVVVAGVEGAVEELGFRSTRIRTPNDSLVTLPNANLLTAVVDNFGLRRSRRWSTSLGLTYDATPEQVEAFCAGVRELIIRNPYARDDSYQVYLNAFADSSLSVLLQVYFRVPDRSTELRERHRLMLNILRLAERLGVEFAFPTQTVHVNTDAPDSSTEVREPPTADDVHSALRKGRAEARAVADSILGGMEEPPPASAAVSAEEEQVTSGA